MVGKTIKWVENGPLHIVYMSSFIPGRLRFFCLRCSNKMARKKLILIFAAIEIFLCLVTVLLQL